MTRLHISKLGFPFALVAILMLVSCWDRPYECERDADCDDGLWCNGEEVCRVERYEFLPVDTACGAPNASLWPCCSNGMGFASCEQLTTRICNEETRQCQSGGECITDGDCADAFFCNGVERCISGACLPDPFAESHCCPYDLLLIECGNGLCRFCDLYHATLCNEETDECELGEECTSDVDCDDGLFCNGQERCIIVINTGHCFPATGPACPGICNEAAQQCDAPD